MSNTKAPTVVIIRARRHGLREATAVARTARPHRAPRVDIVFVESSAMIEAKLGVWRVGAIWHDVATGKWLWALDLTLLSKQPQRAATIEIAKAIVAGKIRNWCEAAGVASVRGGQ
jgi:hypothetical protein